mmetsp:Transcript_58931/g.108872  ORF Transcript_58931/g.108872 Transcript_58931/m.108872 type:complete len:427 (+) Transcript_58931:54-1334(+)
MFRALTLSICIYLATAFSQCLSKDDCHREKEDDDVPVEISQLRLGDDSISNTTLQQILTSLAHAQRSPRQHRRGLTLAAKGLSRLLPRSMHGASREDVEAAKQKMENVLRAMFPEGPVQMSEAAKPRALLRTEGKKESSEEPEGQELLDTTKLALVTYHTDDEGFSFKESPWPMVAHYIVRGKYSSRDMVTLHAKDGRCVVTFEGSDDLMDFIDNFKFTHQVVACGGKYLKGFWQELANVLSARAWEERFIPILTSDKCQTIYSAGHSLGGALAEIFAACANYDQLHRVARNAKTRLTVDKVYSTGSPAVSTVPVSNPKHPSGCFDGIRAFISDQWHYDVVAACTGLIHFKHPYLKPMAIQDSMSNGNYTMRTWDCHGYEAQWEPMDLTNNISIGPVQVPVPKMPDVEAHLPDAYIERLQYIYNIK